MAAGGTDVARPGSQLLKEIFDVISRLPWWVGLGLAPVSYLALHQLAVMEITVSTGSGMAAAALLKGLPRGLATALQYVIPPLCVVAAAIPAWNRYRQRRNYAAVAAERGQDALEMLSWSDFEKLVGDFFRHKGFSVQHRGGKSPDGGVDLVAQIGDDRYLVQCKHWRVQRVGVTVVREICGVTAAEGAAGAFVVTSGSFTDEARKFVAENRIAIELITGDQLHRMIRALEESAQAG